MYIFKIVVASCIYFLWAKGLFVHLYIICVHLRFVVAVVLSVWIIIVHYLYQQCGFLYHQCFFLYIIKAFVYQCGVLYTCTISVDFCCKISVYFCILSRLLPCQDWVGCSRLLRCQGWMIWVGASMFHWVGVSRLVPLGWCLKAGSVGLGDSRLVLLARCLGKMSAPSSPVGLVCSPRLVRASRWVGFSSVGFSSRCFHSGGSSRCFHSGGSSRCCVR